MGESAVCYFCFVVFCFFAGQWFQADVAAVWAFLTKPAHTSCYRLPVSRQVHPSRALPSALSDATGASGVRVERGCPAALPAGGLGEAAPAGDRCGIPRHSPGAGALSARGKESKALGDVKRGKADTEASRNLRIRKKKKKKSERGLAKREEEAREKLESYRQQESSARLGHRSEVDNPDSATGPERNLNREPCWCWDKPAGLALFS